MESFGQSQDGRLDRLSADELLIVSERCELLEEQHAEGAPLDLVKLAEGVEGELRLTLLGELAMVGLELLTEAGVDDPRAELERANPTAWPVIAAELNKQPTGGNEASTVSVETTCPTCRALVTVPADEVLRLLAERGVANLEERKRVYAVAAKALRRLRVDFARERLAKSVAKPHFEKRPSDTLSLHTSLKRLANEAPRQAEVVELRYFGGFSREEIADLLDLDVQAVNAEYEAGRAWLFRDQQPAN